MVLQTNGSISMSQLKTEFGGGTSIKLSDYYNNATAKYAITVAGVPNSGNPLSLANNFYGKSVTSNYSNLVLFLDATNSNSYTGSGAVNWIDLSTSINTVALTNCGYSNINNGVVTLDGASSYAYKATFANMNSSNFSIIAWIYPTSNFSLNGYNGGFITQLNRSPTIADKEYGLLLNSFWDYDSGYGFNNASTNKILTSNWYQIAFVKNNSNGVFYKNGTINGTAIAFKNAQYGNSNFCIGIDYRNNTSYYAGNISKIMIYNYSLTAAEITSNFNNYRGLYGI